MLHAKAHKQYQTLIAQYCERLKNFEAPNKDAVGCQRFSTKGWERKPTGFRFKRLASVAKFFKPMAVKVRSWARASLIDEIYFAIILFHASSPTYGFLLSGLFVRAQEIVFHNDITSYSSLRNTKHTSQSVMRLLPFVSICKIVFFCLPHSPVLLSPVARPGKMSFRYTGWKLRL